MREEGNGIECDDNRGKEKRVKSAFLMAFKVEAFQCCKK